MQSPKYYEFLGRPKMISGKRALEQIPLELEGYGAGRPLILAQSKAGSGGPAGTIIRALYDSNLVIGALYDGAIAGSTSGIVSELAGLYMARKCDSIIAIGGGALVDVAKCVNIEVTVKKPPLQLAGEGRITRELKPMVLVPVALVSGNEAANRTFIDGMAVISDFLSPDIVAIDHRMTMIAESDAMLFSGMIALAHAVEASISATANPMIDAYAYASIRLLCGHLPAAVKKPSNKKSSVAVANAASFAATAFSNAPAGMTHYLAEALADGTGINPGISMGLLVRSLLKARMADKKGVREELCLALAGPELFSSRQESARTQAAVDALEGIFNELGGLMPGSLKELGVAQDRLKETVRAAVKASPSKLPEKECMDILSRAWEGK